MAFQDFSFCCHWYLWPLLWSSFGHFFLGCQVAYGFWWFSFFDLDICISIVRWGWGRPSFVDWSILCILVLWASLVFFGIIDVLLVNPKKSRRRDWSGFLKSRNWTSLPSALSHRALFQISFLVILRCSWLGFCWQCFSVCFFAILEMFWLKAILSCRIISRRCCRGRYWFGVPRCWSLGIDQGLVVLLPRYHLVQGG